MLNKINNYIGSRFSIKYDDSASISLESCPSDDSVTPLSLGRRFSWDASDQHTDIDVDDGWRLISRTNSTSSLPLPADLPALQQQWTIKKRSLRTDSSNGTIDRLFTLEDAVSRTPSPIEGLGSSQNSSFKSSSSIINELKITPPPLAPEKVISAIKSHKRKIIKPIKQ